MEVGGRNAEVGKMDRGRTFEVVSRNAFCPTLRTLNLKPFTCFLLPNTENRAPNADFLTPQPAPRNPHSTQSSLRILRALPYSPCPIPCAPCPMPYPMRSAPRSMPYAPCAMRYAPCALRFALCPMLTTPLPTSEIPNHKHQITNKSQASIINDQNPH